MPMTAKGRKIMAAMKDQYGGEKGERVFYASKNAGKIKGVDKPRTRKQRTGKLSRIYSDPAVRTHVMK